MRKAIGCIIWLAWVGSAFGAVTVTIDFESPVYTTGTVVGQDAWTADPSIGEAVVIDTDNGPTAGGSQALEVTNVGGEIRLHRDFVEDLVAAIEGGSYVTLQYDVKNVTNRDSDAWGNPTTFRARIYDAIAGYAPIGPMHYDGGGGPACQAWASQNPTGDPGAWAPGGPAWTDVDWHTVAWVVDYEPNTRRFIAVHFDGTEYRQEGWYFVDWNGGGSPGGIATRADWLELRLFGDGGNDVWRIDNVVITADNPPGPVIQEVQPDPDSVYPGFEYQRQMVLDPYMPPESVDWTLDVSPGGTINASGLVSGWTPTTGDIGSTFDFTVTASNVNGSDSESWQVFVKAPPTLDGSNVASPWGTIHGNLSGTQSSDDPSLVFSDNWANGAEVAWIFNDVPGGTERGGISFDEAANLYWKSTTGLLVSVAPDGTHRWTGNSGGADVALGLEDSTTPVVGDGGSTGRVYVLSDTGAAAFQKSDGELLWQTPLPDANFSDVDNGKHRLTPVLYDGMLYVVGVGAPTKYVYGLNAMDGSIIWTRQITVGDLNRGWGDAKGQMTLVPDVFGAGVHGLYFNADGGSAGGNALFAIAVDTNSYSGSLQFAAPGGKSAKSHPVYSAVTNRIYTATWGDYGQQFFSFDAVTGTPTGSNSPEGGASGYNDFAVLDFNGTDVLAAGFGGNVLRYHDNGDGTTTGSFYAFIPDYGEFRMYGGLYKSTAGNSIAVMATRESGSNERVIAFDATAEPVVTCFDFDDAPIYMDNLVITTGATGTETTLVDTNGFEGYAVGDLPGQANPGGTGAVTWEDDTGGGASAVGMVQVVDSLPGGQAGKGIMMDADGGCGGWQGAFLPLASEITSGVVIVEWDQYRGDLTDNLWLAENIDYSGWYTLGWDQNGSIYPRRQNGTEVPMTAGAWQHMKLTLDLTGGVATISVDGNTSSFSPLEAGELRFRGWDIEVEGTLKSDLAPPATETIFNYDTGLFTTGGQDDTHICGLQMGPAIDAPQQIYYFAGIGGNLIALRAKLPLPGDFDNDGDVDTDDLIPFVNCDEGPMVPVTDPECAEEDMNDDGFVDMLDFAGWQNCYSGPENPSDPECYP